jgi:sulfite reductase (ferredoxin)
LDKATSDIKFEKPITLNINGCPNSCARIQIADIGLKGQLLPDGNGGQEPGFQVHLGGGLASRERDEAGLGRTVRGLKVTAANLTEYVERVVRTYEGDKTEGETFGEWAHRAEEDKLK